MRFCFKRNRGRFVLEISRKNPMTLLELAMVLLVCAVGLSVWLEHKEFMKKLDVELKELEIELEEMRKGNERTY
jgi:hypothetical protein